MGKSKQNTNRKILDFLKGRFNNLPITQCFIIRKNRRDTHAGVSSMQSHNTVLFPHIHLFQQVAGAAELVDDEEDVTNIDVDAALQFRVEHNVAAQCLPVAVEG